LVFSALTLFLIWFVRSQILSGRGSGGKDPAARLLTASILTDVLCEMMAINGLTLFLLTRNPFSFYIFLFLSFTLFSYFFPRYAQWEEWAERVEAAENPVVWVPLTFSPRPELHQGRAPTPRVFSGQPERYDLR
jgi:hypothetical protein